MMLRKLIDDITSLNLKNKLISSFRFNQLIFNFSIRSFANLLSKLMGLITLPVIARALGPDAFGKYNLAVIIANYTALPIAIMGLRSYGIREIASERKPDSYALNIISIQSTTSLLGIILSTVICFIIFKDNFPLLIAIYLGYFLVLAQAFDLEFYFNAKRNLAFPTYASLIGQTIYIIFVGLFIKERNDFVLLVLFTGITPTISILIQSFKYFQDNDQYKISLSLKEAVVTFKRTYKLGISQNLEGIIPSIPQILLPVLYSTYALGILNGGLRIYSVMMVLYTTFYYALAPYLVGLSKKPLDIQKKYHLMLFLSVTISTLTIGIILYYWGEYLVNLLLGTSFKESEDIFRIISISLVPMTPILMLLGNIMIYANKEKYYFYSLLISGSLTILTALFLVNNYGAKGAVYTLIISNISSIILLFYFYSKIYLYKVEN